MTCSTYLSRVVSRGSADGLPTDTKRRLLAAAVAALLGVVIAG
jgi:hypothetical protein